MSASHSKSAFLYGQIRQALRSGDHLPGQRIDPTTLAMEFRTSATPVRLALSRLVGERLVDDHARNGLHVPLPNEVGLRDLYDWMQRLLSMACDIGFTPASAQQEPDAGDDGAKLTWQLFDAIAHAIPHRSLQQAVLLANDRLAPVRHTKRDLIEHAHAELSGLTRHWQERDIPALRAALHAYYERRKKLVPCIVAMMSDHLQ